MPGLGHGLGHMNVHVFAFYDIAKMSKFKCMINPECPMSSPPPGVSCALAQPCSLLPCSFWRGRRVACSCCCISVKLALLLLPCSEHRQAFISSRASCSTASSAVHFTTPQAGLMSREFSLMQEAPGVKECLQNLHSTLCWCDLSFTSVILT